MKECEGLLGLLLWAELLLRLILLVALVLLSVLHIHILCLSHEGRARVSTHNDVFAANLWDLAVGSLPEQHLAHRDVSLRPDPSEGRGDTAGGLWFVVFPSASLFANHTSLSLFSRKHAGNFSAPKAQEIVLGHGKVLELIRPDPETGKLVSIYSTEIFGLIRSLQPFRLTGTKPTVISLANWSQALIGII